MADKTKEKETKAVTPWRPFMDLTRWERDMDRVMDDFLGGRYDPGGRKGGSDRELDVRAPAVDVFEEKDDIVVKAELPGMDKENIEVNLTDTR